MYRILKIQIVTTGFLFREEVSDMFFFFCCCIDEIKAQINPL